jgi:hypothetical protein
LARAPPPPENANTAVQSGVQQNVRQSGCSRAEQRNSTMHALRINSPPTAAPMATSNAITRTWTIINPRASSNDEGKCGSDFKLIRDDVKETYFGWLGGGWALQIFFIAPQFISHRGFNIHTDSEMTASQNFN